MNSGRLVVSSERTAVWMCGRVWLSLRNCMKKLQMKSTDRSSVTLVTWRDLGTSVVLLGSVVSLLSTVSRQVVVSL